MKHDSNVPSLATGGEVGGWRAVRSEARECFRRKGQTGREDRNRREEGRRRVAMKRRRRRRRRRMRRGRTGALVGQKNAHAKKVVRAVERRDLERGIRDGECMHICPAFSRLNRCQF